jgi:uncharacterized membrane protein
LRPGGFSGLLTRKWTARTLPLSAAAELIGDKLPFARSRIEPPSLMTRAVTGGGEGAAIYRGAALPRWRGALAGAVGALFGSFAGNRYRGYAVEATGLPDLPFAIAEDALATGGAYALLRRPRLGVLLGVLAVVVSIALRRPPATNTDS